MALAEPPPWAGWTCAWPRGARAGSEGFNPLAAQTPPAGGSGGSVAPKHGFNGVAAPAGVPAKIAAIDDLPPGWLDQLASVGIVAQSFVEGTAHVLRLEVNRYR